LVVDQRTLDSNKPMEFKLAKGSISANIISDNNVYQNHFLCLKSDKPCQVEIVIDKKEIQFVNRNIKQPVVENDIQQQNKHVAQIPRNKHTNWFLIFALCALGAGGVAYYYFVYSKKKEKMTISQVNPVPPVPITAKLNAPEIETVKSNNLSARLLSLLEPT